MGVEGSELKGPGNSVDVGIHETIQNNLLVWFGDVCLDSLNQRVGEKRKCLRHAEQRVTMEHMNSEIQRKVGIRATVQGKLRMIITSAQGMSEAMINSLPLYSPANAIAADLIHFELGKSSPY